MRNFSSTPWWVRFFFGLGLGGTLFKTIQVFTGLGREGLPPTAPDVSDADTPEFLDALSQALSLPIRRGGAFVVLENGDQFYPDLIKEIRLARDSIHIMTYIWRPGKLSQELMDLLVEQARQGIEVRLLIDGVGSFIAPLSDIERLRNAGGKVVFFAPVFSRHVTHVTRRNHSRAFVIDGRIGYAGGMTVATHWTGHAQDPDHWRDTMIRCNGSAAHTLQEHFSRFWSAASGELLAGSRYFPDPDTGTAEDPPHIGLAHYASHVLQPLRYLYWYSFRAARRRIYLTNAYFAPDTYMRQILCDRAQAGVDVRLLLPGPHIDNFFVRWNAHTVYTQLMKSGVRIFEYQPTMLHARHIVIDGIWTLVGSANVDMRSIRLNHENMLGIHDRQLGRRFEEMFAGDCERAEEIDLDRWRRRPLLTKMRDHSASILKAQY